MQRRIPIARAATGFGALLAVAIVGVPFVRAAALDADDGGTFWRDSAADGLGSAGIGILLVLCVSAAALTVHVARQQLRRDALEEGGEAIVRAWAPVELVASLAVVGVFASIAAGFIGMGMQPLSLTWPEAGESPLWVVPTALAVLAGPVLAGVALLLARRARRSLEAGADAELELRTRHAVVGRRHHEPTA